MEFFALCEVNEQTDQMGKKGAQNIKIRKMAGIVICFQWDNTYRHMSWRSYSPFWPYPPAAPVWGCPGDERGRNEKPHIRAIRLGTILLLSSKESGVNVGHIGQIEREKKKTEKSHELKLKLSFFFFKDVTRVRNSHLYWCYLENLSLNPSTPPVNWCRGWWSFAAYFLLHWRREKEPKSKHRFVRVCVCEVKSPASPPLLSPPVRAAFTPTWIQHRDNYRNGERRHLSLSRLFPFSADAPVSLAAVVWDGEWLQH